MFRLGLNYKALRRNGQCTTDGCLMLVALTFQVSLLAFGQLDHIGVPPGKIPSLGVEEDLFLPMGIDQKVKHF